MSIFNDDDDEDDENNDDDDDDNDDEDDEDDGYPAYSHQVGIWHHDDGWEYDTVKFPPYTY